jgi:hypothetical protein
MSIVVRLAAQRDISALMEQLRQFDRFFGAKYSLIPTDASIAEAVLTNVMDNHVFLVAVERNDQGDGSEDWEKIIGFIAGVLAPHYFNPGITVLSELLWWVDPNYRGSRAGMLLLDTYTDIGRLRAHWTTMTLEAESPVHPHTLEKRGYRLKETNFMLEV